MNRVLEQVLPKYPPTKRLSEALTKYLSASYRRRVLGHSIPAPPVPHADPALIAEIKAEIARIDAMKLGANLATRDYPSYENRRTLEALLALLEVSGTFRAAEAPDQAKFLGPKTVTLAATEGPDRAHFNGTVT